MFFDAANISALSLGGQILGGGGGGRKERGLQSASDALGIGAVQLINVQDLASDDIIVTVSGVGAPSQKAAMYTSAHYLRALDLLEQRLGKPIAGFIPSEMGASSAFGPFILAAAKGLPVVDAACDGRAHPLGTMGSLGLDRDPNYQTLQVSCGGKPENGTYTEMAIRGTVAATAQAIRLAAQLSGGLTTVVRNPVDARYIGMNAAIGCYTQAMRLGQTVSAAVSPLGKAAAAAGALNGEVVVAGTVTAYNLLTNGGLDCGNCVIERANREYSLFFYNEFMALECGKERLYTFPDLMTAIDLDTGDIIPTADLHKGQNIAVIAASYQNLILSSGLRIPDHYKAIERVLNIPILPFIRELFE